MQKINAKGFTLVEVLLVSVVVGAILLMTVRYYSQQAQAMQMDKATTQMQEILNAGLSYYINNSAWPADIATLQAGNYLPANIKSPFATDYTVTSTATPPGIFSVILTLPSGYNNNRVIGLILAGRLPFGVSATAGPITKITASVNLPMGNINNAGNLSYASLYHNGGCVPVPTCPIDKNGTTLKPQIMVVPASVSGMNDSGTSNAYPMSSIRAYARDAVTVTAGFGAPGCGTDTSGAFPLCYSDTWNGTMVPDGKYWRVCLEVITSKGAVVWDGSNGQYATVLAVTRCAPANEANGSGFNVWSST